MCSLTLVRFTCLIVIASVISIESQVYDNQSYSTSVVYMINLLHVEAGLIENLNYYAELMQKKVNLIKHISLELQMEHRQAKPDFEAYLSNPLRSFSLMRRTYSDWNVWLKYMKEPVGQEQITAIENLSDKMPTLKDYNDAVDAMFRIKEVYNLRIEDMANGLLNGQHYNTKLSALDCYAIATFFSSRNVTQSAEGWARSALQLYNASHESIYELQGVNHATISFELANLLLKQNKHNEAITVIDNALVYKPNNRSLMNYRNELNANVSYLKSCKAEVKFETRLHCRYKASSLILAKWKVEELHHDPYIALYHDAISEAEISEIRHLSLPLLKRLPADVNRQLSQSTALLDGPVELIDRLNRRLANITGLSVSVAEPLEVVNYGMGGYQYKQVPDMAAGSEQRISTVLFHLNDVRKGGADVFPLLKTVIRSKKGAAIVWQQIATNGNVYPKSWHASCPVLIGSKWIAKKVIYAK